MTVKKVIKGIGAGLGAVVGAIFGVGVFWGAILGQTSSNTSTDYSYDYESKKKRDEDSIIDGEVRTVNPEDREAIERELERLWKQYNSAGWATRDEIMERIKAMEAKL